MPTKRWQAPVPSLHLLCKLPLGVLWPRNRQFVGRMQASTSDTAWTVCCWLLLPVVYAAVLGSASSSSGSKFKALQSQVASGKSWLPVREFQVTLATSARERAIWLLDCKLRAQTIALQSGRNSAEGSVWALSICGDKSVGIAPNTSWINCPRHSRGLGWDWAPEEGCKSLGLGLQEVPGATCWSWSRWRRYPYL